MTTTIQTLSNPKIAVIITAAGSSTRMGSAVKKEFLPLRNGTVISSCAGVFLNALSPKYEITDFIITCRPGSEDETKEALKSCGYDGFTFVAGGKSRQESVFKGLLAVEAHGCSPDIVPADRPGASGPDRRERCRPTGKNPTGSSSPADSAAGPEIPGSAWRGWRCRFRSWRACSG